MDAGGMFQIGGALSSAVGSYFGAQVSKINMKAQAALMDHQAAMAEINARIAETGAQSTLMQGEKEVGRITMHTGQVKSGQRAAMAANGIDLGVGNAAEVQATTDTMGQIDANTANANSVRSAWGLRTQSVNYKNEALMDRANASSTRTMAGAISPWMSAATSLLGSAGSVASSWYEIGKATGSTVPGFSSGDLGNGLRF